MSQCPLCHQLGLRKLICDPCYSVITSISRKKNYCIRCGRTIIVGSICSMCQAHPVIIDNFWASYDYKPPISKLIKAWKFHSKIQYSNLLSQLMLLNPPVWITTIRINCIIAMPLTIHSYKKRLFNQSLELAVSISKQHLIPIWNPIYITKHNQKLQHHLPQQERIKNIKNAFLLHRVPSVENILIIDDVATTAATLNELAKCLKRKNNYRIFTWVLAH